MDPHEIDPNDDLPTAKVSEGSSALYSWANLHGSKHRDFSATRREPRTQMRHRASQQEGESSTTPVPAERDESPVPNVPVLRPSRESDRMPQAEGVERRKGVRRVEAAVTAEAASLHHERAHGDSAQRQAARDAEFDLRRRQDTVLQNPLHGDRISERTRKVFRDAEYDASPLSQASDEVAGMDLATGLGSDEDVLAEKKGSSETSPEFHSLHTADSPGPAWLYASPTPPVPPKPLSPLSPSAPASVADTLQYSRERVASRWFALKGVFEQPDGEQIETLRQKETRTPVLAVYSLAGGVGKTSLVATVGRTLSSLGEKVLLTDTTSHGLLPFYFGASELQYDTVRTFSPPSGSTDAPIYLVSHDMGNRGSEQAAQELFIEEVITNSQGMHRILLDLTVASSWVIRQMARMNLTVLVPVAPDMNSVISLGSVEKFFSGLVDDDARPLQPYYVLNQFDPSLPLHLDVREVLRRKLGDRLLPFVIRRAPAVSEALAEGMTVVDYAPDAPVAEDYINVATWLRALAAPAAAGFRSVRWTER